MTQIELLTMHKSLLKVMEKNDIKAKDVNLIDLCNDAEQMESENLPKSYIVHVLADKYKMSVRSVYSTIDKLHRNVVFSC